MHSCVFSLLQLLWPWHCERRCDRASTSAPTNVLFLSGDRMLSARCDAAVRIPPRGQEEDDDGNDGEQRYQEVLWEAGENERDDTVLMASCTEMGGDAGEGFRARDCVNGSLIPRCILLKNLPSPFIFPSCCSSNSSPEF